MLPLFITAIPTFGRMIRTITEKMGPGKPPRRQAVRAAMVSAVFLVAVAAALLVVRRERSPIARIVSLAPATARVVEARLTGGLAWAPYRGANRGTDTTSSDASRLRLAGAAGEIVDRADHDGGAENHHAAGVALLLIQEPVNAITQLEGLAQESKDAAVWSDLAAARLAASSQLGRASLLPMALAAADKALQIQPGLPEALFNRALILEHLGLLADARSAWQLYLQSDPSSAWGTEARSHLTQLPLSTHFVEFERDRPLLEAAAARGDTAAVRRYVDAHRELARRYAEGVYLGHWGEAVQRKDGPEAARWLSIARSSGDALFAVSGEALLRDAVHAIDAAPAPEQEAIAAAHVLYLNGRIAYSRDQRDVAGRALSQAAEAFETLHDPMAFQARLSAASARRVGNDPAGARRDLQNLLSAANEHPAYMALGAYVRWELGLALSDDDAWYPAANVLSDGAAIAQRAGEKESEGFINQNLAFALTSLGRNDDAWLARSRGFSALSIEGNDPQRLATAVAAAANAELSAGHRDAALALTSTDAAIAHNASRPFLAINGLLARTLLQSMNGDDAAALATARRATGLAAVISDSQIRVGWQAKVDVASGAALSAQNPRAAVERLTQAIDFYAAHGMTGALLDPLLLRSRCLVRTGDIQSAMGDLDRGMTIVENHPGAMSGTTAGWSLLDAEHALFTDAVRLSLDRGDKAGAFTYAERSHGAPLSIADLQRRLSGSGAVILEFVALPGELVTFAVSDTDFTTERHHISMKTLASRADDVLSEAGTTAAANLYDDLIRPAERVLDRAREVVIVTDPRLPAVPFAALYDSVHRRFLTERAAVSTASSAGSLEADPVHPGSPVLAAIVLPSGGDESARLPDTEREVRDIAAFYSRSTPVSSAATFANFRAEASGANVIHISGHTEQQRGGGEQALLFSGKGGLLERISWKNVTASPALRDAVVVLAACETLRPPTSSATHALSLGAAFAVAGASDVVGTLAPLGDRDARLLFQGLHRELASGARPADALRTVQREAIASEKNSGGSHAWRAIASLTRRIPLPASGRSHRG